MADICLSLNVLKPEQNGRHLAHDIDRHAVYVRYLILGIYMQSTSCLTGSDVVVIVVQYGYDIQ